MQQEIYLEKAIAGGEQNNCLFNSIAHCLFSLSKDKLEQVSKRAEFGALSEIFTEYHRLDGWLCLDDFLEINKHFNSPYDLEVIWGPVLRQYALTLADIDEEDKEDISAGREVSDEVGRLIAHALGASFVLYSNQSEMNEPLINESIEDAIFQITLCHSENGGGHFDFYYPNDIQGELSLKHNNAYENVIIEEELEDGIKIIDNIRQPISSQIYEQCKDVNDVALRKEIVDNLLFDFMTNVKPKQTLTMQHDLKLLGKRDRTQYQEDNKDEPDDNPEPLLKRICIIS